MSRLGDLAWYYWREPGRTIVEIVCCLKQRRKCVLPWRRPLLLAWLVGTASVFHIFFGSWRLSVLYLVSGLLVIALQDLRTGTGIAQRKKWKKQQRRFT